MRIFSEGLRHELRDAGINVVVVMPGAMRTGIVENSPYHSEESKARLRSLSEEGRGFGLSPEGAAQKILAGIDRGKHRIVLGTDAWILDKLYRIAPATTLRVLHWALQRFATTATS